MILLNPKRITYKLLLFYQRKKGLFTSTNIETYGYCNRKCDFCFNSDRFSNREVGRMDENIWRKIVDELASVNFAGRISPHFYGEPLLDKRLPDLIAYARKKCPFSYIKFGSNGDMLTEQLLLKLIKSGLDRISVTNYDESPKDSLIKLSKKYSKFVSYRSYKDINLANRGGTIFDRENKKSDMPCSRPSEQLVINWKGDVLLCCNDYYGKHVFGNVKDESLLDIWKNESFKKIRKKLQINREKLNICNNCDQ